MELHLGLMKPAEIAQWFGVTDKVYQNTRLAKLEQLKQYCDYKPIPRRGIEVYEIYNPVYSPSVSGKKKVEALAEKKWPVGTYNVISRVGRSIYDEHPELELAETSIISYTGAWKRHNWGISKFRKTTSGVRGNSEVSLVKVIRDTKSKVIKKYEPLTGEEWQIYFDLKNKYFGKGDLLTHEILNEYVADKEKKDTVDLDKAARDAIEKIIKVKGYTNEIKRQKYKAELKEKLGELDYAIICKDGIFFENEANTSYYLEKLAEAEEEIKPYEF